MSVLSEPVNNATQTAKNKSNTKVFNLYIILNVNQPTNWLNVCCLFFDDGRCTTTSDYQIYTHMKLIGNTFCFCGKNTVEQAKIVKHWHYTIKHGTFI